MAALPASRVHVGFWIDYQYGAILGATITATSANANLIIAVLSVLVTFTGSHLWDLIAFTSYWFHVSKQARDTWKQQQQILARNISSPGTFLLETVKVGWAWRYYNAGPDLMLEAVLAFFCSVGFLIAGIFVSQVVSSSHLHVRVHSDSCGVLLWRNGTTSLHREYQQLVFGQAQSYLEACYNQTSSLPQCNIYVTQAVQIQNVTHTACPFRSLCTNHSAIRLDTGLLDSNEVFGINTPKRLTVKVQRVVTCAPVRQDSFFSQGPMPSSYAKKYLNRDVLFGEQINEWFMGPLTASKRLFNSTFWLSNYTAELTKTFDLTPRAYYVSADDELDLRWHNSTFLPIEGFRRTDADTHIMAVQNRGVVFYAPNDDPIFSAHKEKPKFFDDNTDNMMYTGDRTANFLGCAEQMRFCFHQTGCTPLLGVRTAFEKARAMASSIEQQAILQHLFLQSPNMYDAARTPMRATSNPISFQMGLPSNQWEIEIQNWFNSLLATTQTVIPHLAAGPDIVRADFDSLQEPPMWPGFCHSQRMGAPDGFSNINVLGLVLIVSFSGVVILVNLTLVPTLKYFHGRGSLSSPRMEKWVNDGVLQLQRRIYQDMGYGKWLYQGTDVPIIASFSSHPVAYPWKRSNI